MIDPKTFHDFQESLAQLEGKTFDEAEFFAEEYPQLFEDPNIENRGSYIKVHSQKPRTKTLEILSYRPNLSIIFGAENRGTMKEFYLLGILCTWHLLKNAKSLCAYVGGKNHDGFLKKNLQLIQDKKVIKSHLIPESLNLFIQFENNLYLGVFPKHVAYEFTVDRHFSSNNFIVHKGEILFGMRGKQPITKN